MTSPVAAPPSSGEQFRALSVLIGVGFIDMVGFMLVLPLLPFYAQRLSASPLMIGAMIASFSIAQLIASPVWGRVSDRYGRRPALMIGLISSGFGFLIFGFANAIWLLFLSRLVQGAGGGTTGVAQAYVSDTVAPEDRARALGWLSAASSAGVMVGPAIGALVIAFGRQAPGFVAAGLCFINVLAAWKWLPESQSHEMRNVKAHKRPVWHAAWMAFRHPSGEAQRLIWIYGTGMLAFSLFTSMLALFLGARFGITEKTISYFFVYSGFLNVILRSLLLGPVIRRFGEVWAMRSGAIILGIGLLLYPFAPTLWWLVVIIPGVPIGTALLFPASTSLLSRATDPRELGTMMGVAQTFAGISRIIAPIAGGAAFQHLGVDAPFILGGITMLAIAAVAWRVVKLPAPILPDISGS